MKYTAEIGSGVMIHKPSFIKVGTDIRNLIFEIHRHTDRREMWYTYSQKVSWKLNGMKLLAL
jgi:hypothetical protein